mgnify:CR=1 FL=1
MMLDDLLKSYLAADQEQVYKGSLMQIHGHAGWRLPRNQAENVGRYKLERRNNMTGEDGAVSYSDAASMCVRAGREIDGHVPERHARHKVGRKILPYIAVIFI